MTSPPDARMERSDFFPKLIASGILLFLFALLYVVIIAKSQLMVLGAILLAAAVFFFYHRSPSLKELVSRILAKERATLLILGFALAVLAPLPLRRDPYTLHVLVMTGISMILALGLNFQVGSTGIPNLGFAAFYGVGAYASSLLAIHFQLSFWITMLLGGLLAALFGFLVGLPSLKTRTYHLALVSIAFGLVTYILLNNLAFTGGPNGVKDIPSPVLFGHSLFTSLRLFGRAYPMQLNFYYLTLFLLGLAILGAHFLYHSKVGLFWNAVREDEIAAKCSGINVSRAKLLRGSFLRGGGRGPLRPLHRLHLPREFQHEPLSPDPGHGHHGGDGQHPGGQHRGLHSDSGPREVPGPG